MPGSSSNFWKKLIRLAVFVLVAYLLMMFGWMYGQYSDIRSGEMTCTPGIGWIDWGHARMDGPANLLTALRNSVGNQPVDSIRYSQQMYHLGVWARLQKDFTVQQLDSARLIRTGWEIYRQVSEGFEAMQGGFPFSALPFIHRSSFEPADDNGNRLAFYCAANGISSAHLKASLPALSPDEAVAKYFFGQADTTPRPDSQQAMLMVQIDAFFYDLERATPCPVTEISTLKTISTKHIGIRI